MKQLQVCMLGEFSLRCGDNMISDSENRSRKVWNMLAYLICNRERSIPQQKLIDLLWGEDSSSSNPENAMRITMHRARGLLDQLWDGAGRELIVRRDGGYGWNNEIEMELDCERFMQLVQTETEDEERRLQDMLAALKLYRGVFLPRQAGEMWAIPAGTHFQARYLSATLDASALLFARGRYEEAVDICRLATATEPYHEPLYQCLMQGLAAMGDLRGVNAVYEKLSKRLADDFGIEPGDETRSVYRSATQAPKDKLLPVEQVLEDLHEPESDAGAMQCDYDHFKVLCFAERRAMERNGKESHVALLSLAAGTRNRDEINRIMEELSVQIRKNLRRGDVVARCSATQCIMMLPGANYENSCMVCRRVIAACLQNIDIGDGKINFIAQPLNGAMRVP